MYSIIYERVEHDNVVIRSIVGRQATAVINVAIPIADVHANRVGFEIVVKDFVAITKDAHPLRVAHVIAVIQAIISVPLAYLASNTIQHSIVPVTIAARFVGNNLVLALATDEQVIFDDRIASREAQS